MSGKHEISHTPATAHGWWRWVVAVAITAILATAGWVVWQSGIVQDWLTAHEAAKQPAAVTTTVTTTTTTASPTTTTAPTKPPRPPLEWRLPEEMRGVFLRAGTDYDPAASGCREQIDAAFQKIGSWTWNTVIVTVTDLPADGAFDAAGYIAEQARAHELALCVVIDCGVADGVCDPTSLEGWHALSARAPAIAAHYEADAYLFGGYAYPYGAKPPRILHIDEMLEEATEAVRDARPTVPVGLLTEAVWAHASVKEGGSKTANVYEELTDGGADSRALVLHGVPDLLMVKDHRATGDYSASFGTVLDWWAALCEQANLPLYISHSAANAAGGLRGWTMTDQLARQVLACQRCSAWKGSAFDSLAALGEASAAATAMQQAFDGTLMEEYITRTLTLSSPGSTAVTTNESSYSLRGSADPNFPLLLNGKELELTDHGYFSLDVSLSPGANTFTFENKGVKTTYTITYKIRVFQSAAPDKALTLDGGATVALSAVAHKDSTVFATVAGTRIPMAATVLQDEENDGQNESDYVTYTGSYTMPAGLEGETRPLGAVTFTGTCMGQTETRTGGTLTVNALPVVVRPETKDVTMQELQPIDPSGEGEPLATGTVMIITADYAETFSGDTTDDYSRPTNAYLPQGTTDVLAGTAYDTASGRHYYLLGCGRRVYKEDAEEYITGGSLSANHLAVGGVTVSGRETALTLKADWRVPFQLQLLPQAYGNPKRQDYSSAAQTTEYLELTFYYTTEVTGTPDVSGSPLFKSAEWVAGSEAHTQVLRLHLTKAAQFYGYHVQWDNEGVLTFTFRHPTSVAGNDAEQPLKGFKVVLDPGHGGNSVGTAGGTLAEKTLVLTYSLLLREKLEALGATVQMTRTTDASLSLLERTQITRPSGADLFISIHMNGSTSAAAHGCSIHYFSDYSIGIANTMCANMKAVYDAFDSPNSGKVVWSPFYVCRVSEMPALLLECGYMTNATDLERLITPDFQDALTSAMAETIVTYAKSLPTL